MICQKCNIDFPESKIEISHDIPKYMGGTDKDGRHALCNSCHKEYENEIIKLAFMNLVLSLSENRREICRNSARIVQKYYFKDQKI